MGLGPVPATQKILAKTKLSLPDMDVIELNEAFAAQVLACTRQLGLDDRDPRLNPNGGAIALGHPLAASTQFWIGEAYFRSRDFEQAASKYQKAIDLAPTGERTPDALLRLGLALRSLRREDRAREVWARLVRDFPESEAALRARAVLRQSGRTVGPAEPR